MTYDDDFCRIQFLSGTKDLTCKSLGIDWPPPPIIRLHGFEYMRRSYSYISDKDRGEMTHVVRGSLYVYTAPVEA
jgi:hypothetical protein